MTIESKDTEYEFDDPITPYFTTPPEKTGGTLTYFNDNDFVLEIWSIDKVDANPEEGWCKFDGEPIASIPYADLWEGLKMSRWKPESDK